MEPAKIIDMLTDLAQVEMDAVHSYNQILDQISDEVIRSRLIDFKNAHGEHIEEINLEIEKLGGEKLQISTDFKGYVIAAFTALRKGTGIQSALKALKTTEEITNHYYQKVIPTDYPTTVKSMIRRHFTDERNHLEYINNNLQALSMA